MSAILEIKSLNDFSGAAFLPNTFLQMLSCSHRDSKKIVASLFCTLYLTIFEFLFAARFSSKLLAIKLF